MQTFGGELTFLNSETERYFSLDTVGAQMWDAIVESASLAEAHARLVEVFDASPERLEEDLRSLARDFVRVGLLVVRSQ